MSAITIPEAPQLTCTYCGRDIYEYADEYTRRGRCCHHLPLPWGIDNSNNGLFTRSRGWQDEPSRTVNDEEDDPYDEDEEAVDVRPTCPSCGDMSFSVTALQWQRIELHQRARGSDNDYGDSSLWLDPDWEHRDTVDEESIQELRIECRSCGHNCSHIGVEYV